jgi:hypothetical protein
VSHDHDAQRAGGDAPAVLPGVFLGLLLCLELDAKPGGRGGAGGAPPQLVPCWAPRWCGSLWGAAPTQASQLAGRTFWRSSAPSNGWWRPGCRARSPG